MDTGKQLKKESSSSRLLTIGVPTYNRAPILKIFLSQIIEDIGVLSGRVKIVIFDNCSTDATSSVCQNFIKSISNDLEVDYCRNSSNIGVSKNLVSLFYQAKTPYFMFLGDDDCLDAGFFPVLLTILESKNRPSAVIQSVWNNAKRINNEGYVGFDSAVKLFYEYGNAWAGVIDTAAAVNAIESRNLRSVIENIVWPQTVIGYLAMYDSQPRQVYIVTREIGRQLTPGLNIYNKAYWVRSLHDLLKASSLVDEAIEGKLARRSFVSPWSKGLIGHIKAIALGTLLEDHAHKSDEIRSLLRAKFGFRGIFLAFVLFLIDSKKMVGFTSKIMAFILRRLSFAEFDDRLMVLRKKNISDIENIKINNKRFGDWF